MNNSAEICRVVIDDVSASVLSIAEQVGLSERVTESLLAKLTSDGTLKRRGDHISVGDAGRARMVAEIAMKQPAQVPAAAPPPILASQKPSCGKVTLPDSFVVEKGVPIPKGWVRTGQSIPWPFANMEPGDSFAISVPDGVTSKSISGKLRSAAGKYRKLHPVFRYVIRTIDDDKSVRFWREADEKPATTADELRGRRKVA